MNALRNKVQLIGRLGADPEIRTFDSGRMKATLSLATSDVYKDSDGKKVSNTQWHNLVIWGNIVKVVEQYLKKGSEIAVDGKIHYRTYENGQGEKRFFTEIVVNDFVMLGGKNN
jgi:single-strand DNA-binding protein